MCLRVLNNLNPNFPVTGRNMNWFRPIEASLFHFPKGLAKKGLSVAKANELDIGPDAIFCWHSTYASVASVMGDNIQGYATVDGMNVKGLVVNALYDTPATYGEPNPQLKNGNISVLRWPQYILDCFSSVKSVVEYARNNHLQLIQDNVPEGGNATALVPSNIHLAISDKDGQSAIIEVKEGQLSVYSGEADQIVTNEPDYPTQLNILKYWQYQWGQTEPAITTPMFTVPGGTSPTQSFERAAFYLTLSDAAQDPAAVLAQTRALMQNGAVPFLFNPDKKAEATCTRWTNLSDHKAGQYYFINPLNMMPVWLATNAEIDHCAKVQLISVNNDKQTANNHPELQGDMVSHLQRCEDPYANLL
ncbi:linear amide C-N hydrolase [Shewanella sp. 0m-4]